MNVTRKSRSNQGGMTVAAVPSYAALIVLGFNGFAKADTLAFDHTFVFGNAVGVFTPVAAEGVAGQVQLMDKAGDVLANACFLDLPAFPLDLSNASFRPSGVSSYWATRKLRRARTATTPPPYKWRSGRPAMRVASHRISAIRVWSVRCGSMARARTTSTRARFLGSRPILRPRSRWPL
jgi:hypothetical protein